MKRTTRAILTLSLTAVLWGATANRWRHEDAHSDERRLRNRQIGDTSTAGVYVEHQMHPGRISHHKVPPRDL